MDLTNPFAHITEKELEAFLSQSVEFMMELDSKRTDRCIAPPPFEVEKRCFQCKKRISKTMRGPASACKTCQHLFCMKHLNTLFHTCPAARPQRGRLTVCDVLPVA